jgi:hypothetical protein
VSTSSEGGDEQWLVPRLASHASQLSPTVLTAKPGGGLRTWRGLVEILHVTSSIRESSSGLAEVLVFSSELPPSLVVSLVVGERWGGGGEKAVAAQ